MYWSQLFIPTLREIPAEAEVASHRLLLRAGYIRQLSSGIYNYLFLAQRSLLKIQCIIRQEMEAAGAQEIHMPTLQPAELWKQSGRWGAMGTNLFRLQDRNGHDLCLGLTQEENVTVLARGELRSYKQLPQTWFQIQSKFHDEPHPKSGLLRLRQFFMQDAYSFDLDEADLNASYGRQFAACQRIFSRCGLRYHVTEALPGSSGGGRSHEFMAIADAGEDVIVVCPDAGYAANFRTAVSLPMPPPILDPEAGGGPEPFHTPGRKTIADVAAFTGLPETSQMKSLVFVADTKPVLILLRGDHQMSEAKLQAVLGATEIRPAHPSEIQEWLGASAGSLGPVGVDSMPVLADLALRGRRNLIAGANRDGYHLRNVTPDIDFHPVWHDLRQVAGGDSHVETGHPLEFVKAMQIGFLRELGVKYSDALGLRVLDESGREVPVHMGCYGIGIERVLCAAVEQGHDANGMSLPSAIAPFDVVITPVNPEDPGQRAAAESLYSQCLGAGLDALFDDRGERPGVKFKDADLIGVPFRFTFGKKLAQGLIEFTVRRTRESREVDVASALATLQEARRQS